MAKMSGQGVRTHHRMAAEHGLWQAVRMMKQGLLTLVNVFHPDNIFRYYMLSSGWSYAGQHWAAFPLGEAGQPCVLRVIRERGPYTLHTQTVPLAQHSSVHPGKNSVCRHFTSGYLTSEWERRTFQLLRSNISGSSGSAYPVRHAQLYCSPEAS